MFRVVVFLLMASVGVPTDAPDPPGFRRPVFRPGAPADVRRAVEAGTAERLDEVRSLWRSVEFQDGLVARLATAKVIPKEKGTKFAPAISAEQIAVRRKEAEVELASYHERMAAVGRDVAFVPAHPRRPKPGTVGTLTAGPGQTVRVRDDGRVVRHAAGLRTEFWPAVSATGFDSPVRFLGREVLATPRGRLVTEVFEPAPVRPWLVLR